MPKQNKPILESELETEVLEQFRFAKKYLDPVHTKMNELESLYRTYIDGANYPHNARVFDPRTFRIIETVTPRLVANEPTGSFFPVEDGDVATAEILNALIKYDWRHAEMFPKLTMFVKSMLIFGTAFGLTYWDYRECKKTRMVPQELNGGMIWTQGSTQEVSMVDFDGPNFEPLNIYDCFPDPNSSSLGNMRWFIYRTFKTIKELEYENDTRNMEYYKNLDKLKQLVSEKKEANKGASGGFSDMEFREHRRTMLSTEELHGQDSSNPEFVILRRFAKDRWVDIVPEFNLVIRDVPNPYFHGELPIVYGVDYPYPGELYGMGEIEPIERIQRALNAVLNQRLDNVQLVLRNMWKVKKNSGVDMHTLISAPGNIITTDDMLAVESFQVPDVTGNTFVGTMNYLTAAIQNGSGITDYTMGINSSANIANSTATGTRLIQQEANAQFKLKIQLFYKMVVERIANQWKDLRIQFTTEAQKLRIVGKDEVMGMVKNTSLATTGLDGIPVAPGDMETPTKMQISKDQNFAFLNVYPEDIQPSIVGDYDFVAAVSSEAISDPIALQENFFLALDKVNNPEWTSGLASQGKQLNYTTLTEKVFDKLGVGMEKSGVVIDMPKDKDNSEANIRAQINFKDLPPMGQVQLAGQAGIQLDPNQPTMNQEAMPQVPGMEVPNLEGAM